MAKFIHKDRQQKGYILLLLFVSPILALFNILKLKNNRDITFFGTLFFGMIGSLYIYKEGNDGFTHRTLLEQDYGDMSLSEFLSQSYDILTFNAGEGTTDFYLHILSFIAGSVFNIPELLHVLAGLVLGYFYTKSVLLVIGDNLQQKKNYILMGLIVLLLLIKSISALNSIRMWTGMWVLFYGTYGWAKTKNIKYFIAILFSMIVHFSYVVIIIPVAISYLIRERKRILVLIYIISFFTSFGFSYFESFVPKSELFESKQEQYAIDSDEKAERFEKRYSDAAVINSKKSFYKGSGQTTYTDYSIVGLTIVMLFFYLKKESDANFKFLIAVGIGLYTFSNVMSFSPSLQGRTKVIAATFLLAAAIQLQFTLYKYRLSLKTKKRVNFGFICFLLSSTTMVLYQISFILQGFSFFFLIFPELSWLIGDNDFSLREALDFLK
ncbi:MAG: EpsG family protein [Cloacibacterium sp.]|uniref:EpsG family protein n=1 Tax=Cloacibacterium sp. TaxID=1913682 RepID=UPI003C7425F9